ncbi:MAG: hypothetical protein F4Z83_09920, partial [Gemmatimonadetes bacterium]|nr:hypothetical protein [Gemmatimonadota bacterium]
GDGGGGDGDGPEKAAVKPTVTIDTTRTSGGTTMPDSTFTLRFEFSVPATGFTSGDIRITGAEKTSQLTETQTDSIYTLNIETHSGLEGSITVTVLANAVENNGDGNDETVLTFEVDNKPPALEHATASVQTIVLRYHEELDEEFQAAAAQFLVTTKRPDGTAGLSGMATNDVDVEDEFVTLTLAAADTIHAGDSVKLQYTASSNQLRDEKGNHLPAFENLEVDNQRTLDLPGAISDLKADGKSTTEIELTWTKPADGGSAITGYRIEVRKNQNSAWGLLEADTKKTATKYTHEGLTPDTTLQYQVFAINGQGTGPASNTATGSTNREGEVPGAPTGLRATADGDDAIDLVWTAPTNTGSTAITGYKIQYRSNPTSSWNDLVTTTTAATSYTDSPLQPSTTRYYQVAAVNSTGPGAYSNVDHATTAAAPTDPPDPPTGLTATAVSSSRINLAWNPPVDDGGSPITGYRLEWSQNGTSGWTLLNPDTTSTATTYSDTGLDPVTTRHYRVLAININGRSGWSAVHSATTPADVPGMPIGLAAAAQGQTQINLSWTAPTETGGAAITGYDIETSSQGTTRIVQTGTATTYPHTGLTAGSTWRYRVRAKNSEGNGPWSSPVTATTDAAAPGAPTRLTATADGRHRINLIWQAPTSTGGVAITSYEIEVAVHPDSAWSTLVEEFTSFPNPYVHRGLAPGSTRYYQVRAKNSAGLSGPWSNVDSARTMAAPPGAPTELMATARDSSQIDLSWTAPADDGGADISGYRIFFSVTNGQTWNILVGSTGSDATTWSHTGLDPATTRHYRVAALNAAGPGPQSNVANATTDAAHPGKPTELIATADGTSRIELDWEAPSYTGGVPLTGYQVEVSSDGGSRWEILEANTGSPTPGFDHTGLDPASTRHYRVSGINAADLVGDPSNVDSATTDATVPDAPTDLVATKDGTSRIDLEWTAPDYDGGAEITGYRIEVSRDRGLVWRDLVEDTESTATTFPHEGLAPATTRFYRVSAINRVGAGEPSNEANATTDATVPNAPLRLTADAEDHSQIDLDWDIPDFDGGTPITGYRIEVSDNEGATWKALVLDTESLTTAYSHTGLEPATTRHYRVSAINEIGIGEPSNEANATTDAIAPDPPTNLMATASEPTRIDLTWSAPAYDGGAPVTGYRIEVSADGATWADLQRNTGSVRTSYAHVGLEPGSTRHYRVSAINIAGTGEPSNTASATTDDPVERAGRVNAAILPHFAAAATTSTFSAISARIESVASRNPLRSQLNAAGLLSRAGGMGMRGSADGLNMARLFDGASFAMPWGGGPQEQDTGTPIGFTTWGGAEFTSMGEPGGDRIEWEGDMLSIHLGADARVHRDILAGVAGSRSSGSYDFTDVTGAEREVAGTYDAMMTSLNPYVAWLPGRTGVSIWAAGSFGWGEVTVDDEPGGERMSDTRSRAGAVGGSRIMMTRGASALRMRAEGWMSRVEVDGSEGMDSLTLDMRRMRVALEWSQVQALPGGREVNLLVEGGLRYDDGDGSDGAGMEVGGGVRFTSGTRALTVEGHGRLLATSPTDYEEWGFRGMIQVNPQAVLSGLSLRIVPAWGQSASGLQELYERGISDRPDMSHSLQRGRVNTRVEYGLGEFNGTPYGRLYIADGGARAFGTGMRYELSRVLDLRVEGTRTEGASGPARHGLAMRGRWVF